MAEDRRCKKPKYLINPIEIAIFAILTITFALSLGRLIKNQDQLRANALLDPATRSIASISAPKSSSLYHFESQCTQNTGIVETAAIKVRISGPLCGLDTKSLKKSLMKTTVINLTNQSRATVFTDLSNLKFSTDYVALEPGTNTIQIEFNPGNGNTVSQQVSIKKN